MARDPHRSRRSWALTISLSRTLKVSLRLPLPLLGATLLVVEDWRILIGLEVEAGLLEGLLVLVLCLGAEDVILRLFRKDEERLVVVVVVVLGLGVVDEAAPEEGPLLDLPLTLFEFPNQRLRRVLDAVSSSSVAVVLDFCSFSRAWVRLDVLVVGDPASSDCEEISTSSASRYHFLRRV